MLRFIFAAGLVLSLLPHCLFAQDIEQVVKDKHPVKFTGTLSAGTQMYKVQGIDPRSGSPMWNLSGNAALSVYGVQMPFSFTVGRQGTNLNYPTFSQIGVSPSYKWLKLHAGWRNMYLSPYTLAGHTFMGAGIEMKPGVFRFAAMAGRLRKARDYNSDTDFNFYPAVYKRTGYALKMGLGTDKNHVDLIYFRAKDDIHSLQVLPPDSTLTPGENAVLGLSARFSLGKNITYYADGAASLYTRNLFSTEATDYIKPDPSAFFRPRFSTRLNYAVKAGVDFQFSRFQLRTAYERILPEFQTMGAYFFANDLENITLTPTIMLAEGKLRLNTGFGIQRNNLLGNRSETTKRFIGNGNLSYNPGQRFGIDAAYSNMTISQINGSSILTDTIRFAIVTSNYNLTPHWQWMDTSSVKTLVVSGNYQELNDRNPFTREYANMKTYFATASFAHNYLQHSWGWNLGLNFNNIAVYALHTNRYGLSAGLNKNWLDGRISGNLSVSGNLSDIDGVRDGSVWSGNLNVALQVKKRHSFSLYGNLLRSHSLQFEDYLEFQGGLQYSYRLR
ncbi:MAG: hypothetical protein IPL65_19630 [Lewinellaceae bacterium]|nr:hypothetical protein [Lewinellaceae bacterium]